MSDYNVPGDTEAPISDILIARLLTYRAARGEQDGFDVRVRVEPEATEEHGMTWDLKVRVSPGMVGGGETWGRRYRTRTDAYLAFDWYVEELGLSERTVLPDDAPGAVVEQRAKVLDGTRSGLVGGDR